MTLKDNCKRFPWIALIVTAVPIAWFFVSIAAFFAYMLAPKSHGKISPRYVSAFSALYSGLVCLLFVVDYWIYWRSSATKYHLYRLSLVQKIFLTIRILVAIAFCAVAITFTVLFAVLWSRKYAADIIWTCFAILFSVVWLIIYIFFGIRQRYVPLVDDDEVASSSKTGVEDITSSQHAVEFQETNQ